MPVDVENVTEAYNDVRSDSTETSWAVLGYEDNTIVVKATGVDYEEFISNFTDEIRAFGFVRVVTGDEMSKRFKFALVTWCGCGVTPLKKAKLSTDKAEVKRVIVNLAVEIQTDELEELQESHIREQAIKAGGANYGTGQ